MFDGLTFGYRRLAATACQPNNKTPEAFDDSAVRLKTKGAPSEVFRFSVKRFPSFFTSWMLSLPGVISEFTFRILGVVVSGRYKYTPPQRGSIPMLLALECLWYFVVPEFTGVACK